MAPIKQVEVRVMSRTRKVEIAAGLPGRRGIDGDPGIHVGPTPPEDPKENDLWLDTSV